MGAAGVLCFVGMMIAVGVGVKNKPTSQIICGSGIRTAGNTAKQLDASLRKGGLGTGTNPTAQNNIDLVLGKEPHQRTVALPVGGNNLAAQN